MSVMVQSELLVTSVCLIMDHAYGRKYLGARAIILITMKRARVGGGSFMKRINGVLVENFEKKLKVAEHSFSARFC